MNSSDIVNSKYPSPTTRLATLVGSGSTSYTATSPVKVHIECALSGASLTVDGVNFNNQGRMDYWLSSGQSTSISTASGGAIVSIERAF